MNEREKLLKSVKTYLVGIKVLYGVLALTAVCTVSYLIMPALGLLVVLLFLLIFIGRMGDQIVQAVAKEHPEIRWMARIGKFLPVLVIAPVFLGTFWPVATIFLPAVMILGGLIFQHVSVGKAGKILLANSGA